MSVTKRLRNLALGIPFALPMMSASAADPVPGDGRIMAGIVSSDELVNDLKFIVVDLAKEEKAWEESVFPNIDVFLFGVDQKRPVGAELYFDPETGRRANIHVPIANRKVFIEDNLNATDIKVRPIPGDPNFYRAGGKNEVYDGYLRFTEPKGQLLYGSLSPDKAELPASMGSPKTMLDAVLAGNDAAARWVATPATAEAREKGFAKIKSELLAAVEKRPNETKAAYELRRMTVEQQGDRLARLLTNSAELTAAWKTDAKAKKFTGATRMVGMPDSLVAKDIASIGTEVSLFAKIPNSPEAVVTARILTPINEKYREEQTRLYQTWLTAWGESIDRKEGPTPDQKAARKQIAEHFVNTLIAGMSLGWIDAYLEMQPSNTEHYTALMGVRVQDSATILPILEALPNVESGWTTELNAFEEHGVQVHRLNLKAKLPSSLKQFFGETGDLLVGTGDRTVWIAGGPDAEAHLRAAIVATAGPDAPAPTADAVLLTMHMHPALKFLHALLEDDDIELVRSLDQSRLLKNSKPTDRKGNREEADRRVSRDALRNFKWQEKAIAALAAGNDSVDLRVYKEGEALLGSLNVEEGVMRAIGSVVAKFTTEVLR
jgi:hypothetical protein